MIAPNLWQAWAIGADVLQLLANGCFDEGHEHQDGIAEIVVPVGWELHWLDNKGFPGIGTDAEGNELQAMRPESVVWNIADAPVDERPTFFLSGAYCLKIFKLWTPMYVGLSQTVGGLTPGAQYRFVAPVHPDIVDSYNDRGQKVYPDDPWAAEARLGVSAVGCAWPEGEDGDVEWGEWQNAHNGGIAYGQYGTLILDFIAPVSSIVVWLELKCKWGVSNNWFMDSFALMPNGGDPSKLPPRGLPREQYDRTYIIFPDDYGVEWPIAVVQATWDERRPTMGKSADDGGIGDLDVRRVVAINPQDIGTGLTAEWYNLHYPDVEFFAIEAATPEEAGDKVAALLAVLAVPILPVGGFAEDLGPFSSERYYTGEEYR